MEGGRPVLWLPVPLPLAPNLSGLLPPPQMCIAYCVNVFDVLGGRGPSTPSHHFMQGEFLPSIWDDILKN